MSVWRCCWGEARGAAQCCCWPEQASLQSRTTGGDRQVRTRQLPLSTARPIDPIAANPSSSAIHVPPGPYHTDHMPSSPAILPPVFRPFLAYLAQQPPLFLPLFFLPLPLSLPSKLGGGAPVSQLRAPGSVPGLMPIRTPAAVLLTAAAAPTAPVDSGRRPEITSGSCCLTGLAAVQPGSCPEATE